MLGLNEMILFLVSDLDIAFDSTGEAVTNNIEVCGSG